MFDHIGLPEILIILVIVFIFFGAGKLPEVASGLGKAVRNFKKAQRGDFDDEDDRVFEQRARVQLHERVLRGALQNARVEQRPGVGQALRQKVGQFAISFGGRPRSGRFGLEGCLRHG